MGEPPEGDQHRFVEGRPEHRVLDGATANQYLASVKHRLETMGPETAVY